MELSLRDKTNMNEGQTSLEIKKNGWHPHKIKKWPEDVWKRQIRVDIDF